jgi:hypothetical protein
VRGVFNGMKENRLSIGCDTYRLIGFDNGDGIKSDKNNMTNRFFLKKKNLFQIQKIYRIYILITNNQTYIELIYVIFQSQKKM